jgi:cell wall assembly regulator SMI1
MPTSDQSLPDLLRRLQTWLAKHRPRFAAALNPGATATQLGALEAALNIKLPQALRDLLAWHNGQRPGFSGGFERDWLLMSTQTIAAAKRNLDADTATTGWQTSWLPVFDDDAGDYLCLDTALADCPVRAFYLGNKEHSLVAPSLSAWLADLITNVERGKYVEEPERGTFLRKK